MPYHRTRKCNSKRKLSQKFLKARQIPRASSKEAFSDSFSAGVDMSDRLIPPWLFLESTLSNSTSSKLASQDTVTTEPCSPKSDLIAPTLPDTFWPFLRLPKELRLRIFELALPEEEFIHVEENSGLDKRLNPLLSLFGCRRKVTREKLTFNRLSITPHYLEEVSDEAREVVLRRYPFTLPTLIDGITIRFGPQDTLCFDNIEDFANELYLQYLGNEIKKNAWLVDIRKLVIPSSYAPESGEIWDMWPFLSLFQNVRTIRFALLAGGSRYLLSHLNEGCTVVVGRMSRQKKLKMYKRVLKRALSAGIYPDERCEHITTICWDSYRDMKDFLEEESWPNEWKPEIEFVGWKDDWHRHHPQHGYWHIFGFDYRPLYRVSPESIVGRLVAVSDFVEGHLRMIVYEVVLFLCFQAALLIIRLTRRFSK